jgi:hypothetical protein
MAYVYPDGTVTALEPPAGYVSDFDNPQRQYVTAMYVISVIFTIITLFFVFQRYYVQLTVSKGLQIEDGTLFIGWALGIVMTGLILRTCVMGWMGTHAWEMPIEEFAKFMRAFYPMPIVYPLCILFAKLTLLLVYLRLNPARWFKWSIYFTTFFVVGSGISLSLATAFPCQPVAAAYDIFITEFECIDRPALYKATAITGLISDIFLVIIPIPMVMALKMPRKQKFGLMAMFSVGIVTVFTSAMRLVIVIQQLSSADVAWGAGPTAFWVIIEANLMIICASLTTFRHFWRRTIGTWLGNAVSSTDNSNSANARGASGGASALVTFSGSNSKTKRKGKYSRFDDTNLFSLTTFNDVRGGNKEGGGDGDGGSDHQDGGPSNSSEVLAPIGESDSEKGIVQTTTFSHTVSHA